MNYFKHLIFFTSLVLFALSCTEAEKKTPDAEEEKTVVPAKQKITDTTTFTNDVYNFDSRPGAIGVFRIPEMLVLSILDSADKKQVSSTMIKNYAILEEDLNAINAEMNGAIGIITYNNNLNNFTFENILCIKRLPKVQPKHSKIIVLEASEMLVYNFYGSYQNLFSAYDKIKRYCNKNDLIQTGPMREFYITDPELEKNPEKWLTRIMLPVVSMRKK